MSLVFSSSRYSIFSCSVDTVCNSRRNTSSSITTVALDVHHHDMCLRCDAAEIMPATLQTQTPCYWMLDSVSFLSFFLFHFSVKSFACFSSLETSTNELKFSTMYCRIVTVRGRLLFFGNLTYFAGVLSHKTYRNGRRYAVAARYL